MVAAADIKARIKTRLTEGEIQPFIDDAVGFLSSLERPITSEIVTTYMACHFVAIRDPRTNQRSTGASSAVFELATAAGRSGLGSTTYGQQAIAMDLTGQLAQLKDGPKMRATIEAS